MMGLVDARRRARLLSRRLARPDADGGPIFDHVDYATYRDCLQEDVKPWTYMKFPHIRRSGRRGLVSRRAAGARADLRFHLDAAAEEERQSSSRSAAASRLHGALLFHWARMIECCTRPNWSRELLDDPDIVGDRSDGGQGRAARRRVGVIEAPRGTLFHHYRVGDDDLVSYCNLIVSTTNNNQAMNEAIRTVATQYLDGHEITEGLLNHIEVAIRAYDPCLSCATHALGQMPLECRSGRRRRRARRSPPPRLKCASSSSAGATRPGATTRSGRCCAPHRSDAFADVETIEDYQLQVEHALDLDGADSRCSSTRQRRRRRSLRGNPPQRGADAHDPRAVAAKPCSMSSQKVTGRAPPPAFVLGVRGERFEFGEGLSAASARNFGRAARFCDRLMAERGLDRWREWAAASAEGKLDAAEAPTSSSMSP